MPLPNISIIKYLKKENNFKKLGKKLCFQGPIFHNIQYRVVYSKDIIIELIVKAIIKGTFKSWRNLKNLNQGE